jgi:hypothetical protein
MRLDDKPLLAPLENASLSVLLVINIRCRGFRSLLTKSKSYTHTYDVSVTTTTAMITVASTTAKSTTTKSTTTATTTKLATISSKNTATASM